MISPRPSPPAPPGRVIDEMTTKFQKLQNGVVTMWSELGHGTGFIISRGRGYRSLDRLLLNRKAEGSTEGLPYLLLPGVSKLLGGTSVHFRFFVGTHG